MQSILRIAICDDNPNHLKAIHTMLSSYSVHSPMEFCVTEYTSAFTLLSEYASSHYDVFILEANMPGLSGLDLAAKIRASGRTAAPIVFVSNDAGSMQRAFDVCAFHYLIKPIQETQFYHVLDRIIDKFLLCTSQLINDIAIINQNHITNLYNISCIIYIEKPKHCQGQLNFILQDCTLSGHGSLTHYQKSLCSKHFLSPNRNTLINPCHIHSISWENDSIIMSNGDAIHLSRRRVSDFQNIVNIHKPTLSIPSTTDNTPEI